MKWSDGLRKEDRTPAEIIQDAKKLIENPDNWCQGDLAQMEDSRSAASVVFACKFCSLGALHKAIPYGTIDARKTRMEMITILNKAIIKRLGYFVTIADYNDNHSHEEVMKMWDCAIKIAKKEKYNG